MLLNASGCLDALTAPDTARAFDAFVTKTVTPLPRGGNDPVRIAETDVGMLNSIGLANPGIERFLREVLPHALFLVPGYGAQGAPLQAALRGFVRGAGRLEGGMVSSSRGILFGTGPLEASARASIAEWHRGFVARLDAARDEVGAAVALAG